MSAPHTLKDATKFDELVTMGVFFPCGSRVTCNPAPTNTDEDWLVLAWDMKAFRLAVFDNGYALDGSLIMDAATPLDAVDRFASYSRDGVNLIVTQDEEFFAKFKAATSVAKRLNLLDKSDRIALFQAVLYGNSCDEEVPHVPV